MSTSNIVLILGGVRSGKSRFAQELADKIGGSDVLFIATAQAGDAEMSRRIQIHRTSRPDTWSTLEAPTRVCQAIENAAPKNSTVLIDCLTLLVSNVLLQCGDDASQDEVERQVNDEINSLLTACQRFQHTIVVSGEVGLGIVPSSRLARMYRDLLGWANQIVAQRSNATYLMMAGLPVELKALAPTVDQVAAGIRGRGIQ